MLQDEEIKVAPQTKADVDIDKNTQQPQEEDLVSKVASFKTETTEEPKVTDQDVFNVNDINKIEDPQAREYALKAYKSFQRGFNQKFQDLAELRKDFEAKKAEASNWTPEKVQLLLKDKSFVESAQSIAGTQGTDDYRTEEEKTRDLRVQALEREINNLRQQSFQATRQQQDESLKSKYANYDSKAVDIITADLLTGKRPATREDIWKVHDYESAVKRAYEMGRKDKTAGISEKMSSVSTEGYTMNPKSTPLEKDQKETDSQYFKRIVLNNIQKQAQVSK